MGIEQAVINNLRVLPREKQQQVLSFIQSLQQTDTPVNPTPPVLLTEKILPSLQRIQDCWGEPMAVVYADNLLQEVRTLRKQFPFSPWTEILSALHDAMAFQNRWVDYTATQYQSVCELLLSLSTQEDLDDRDVEEAIATLEDLGFNTMPFGQETDSLQIEDPIE